MMECFTPYIIKNIYIPVCGCVNVGEGVKGWVHGAQVCAINKTEADKNTPVLETTMVTLENNNSNNEL